MSTILNDRDVLLQATSPRSTGGPPPSLLVDADAVIFKVTGGVGSPTVINLSAKLVNMTGTVAWSVSGATGVTPSGNAATLAYSAMSGTVATVTAQITYNGTLYLATKIISKVSDGTNGSPGSNGSNGTRGTVNIAASGSSWSDSTADSAIISATGTGPINRDIVTIYSGSFSQAKYYQSGSWLTLDAYINGNMLVSGTFSASQIYGGLLSGVRIGIGSGPTPNGYAFEVNSAGQPWATSLIALNTSIFANSGSTTNSPIVSQCYGSSIAAVTGNAVAVGGAGAHGLRGTNLGNSASGIVGGANGYDFYAEGPGPNGPFTGAHDVVIPNGVAVELGDIVVDAACRVRRGWSNTIFEAAISSTPNQKGVVGVLSMVIGLLSGHRPAAYISDLYPGVDPTGALTHNCEMTPEYERDKNVYQLAAANALGEGQMNVCGEGGDIEAGDFIVTSSTPGKGMRQADDLLRNYTVAKARESVVFSSPSEIKQVACFYVCG